MMSRPHPRAVFDTPAESAEEADAAEILALQRLAYKREAELYDDHTIAPLSESMSDLQAAFAKQTVLKLVVNGRIIGSVRGQLVQSVCNFSRLIVHPEFQGRGVGTHLLTDIEASFPRAEHFRLLTGFRSAGNLRLYRKLGYREFRREYIHDKLTLVHLEKTNRPHDLRMMSIKRWQANVMPDPSD